jgi:translation initiation factor IF-3
MSVSIEIIGNIHYIAETVMVTDKFQKREFVLHIQDGRNSKYDDYIQLQMTMDNCDKLNSVATGDKVKVQVNVRGREWEKKDGSGKAYFNTLEAWKIEVVEAAMPEATPEMPTPELESATQPEVTDKELPF